MEVKPIRVLHVIDSLAVAGAETLVTALALRARASGGAAEVYVLRRCGGVLERALESGGIVVHGCDGVRLYSPWHICRLVTHLRRHSYDVVHVHLFPAQLWVAVAFQVARPPARLIATEHSTSNRRRRFGLRWLDSWMYGRFDAIACISAAVRDSLAVWMPRARGKLLVVENGVDLRRFTVGDRDEPRPVARPGEVHVVCVGRLEAAKGQEVLVRATARAPSVRLTLVGDGGERDSLFRLASKLGVANRIRFLGTRSDVPALLRAADIYVQPSYREGFGLAAVEAMASGCPVVASDVPGLAEVVGDAGVRFVPGDAAELARILERLASDPHERERLGLAGRARSGRFDIRRASEAYAALYRGMPAPDEGRRYVEAPKSVRSRE